MDSNGDPKNPILFMAKRVQEGKRTKEELLALLDVLQIKSLKEIQDASKKGKKQKGYKP